MSNQNGNQGTKPTREELVERGRRGGQKSGETRRARAEMRADLRARMLFVDKAEDIAKEMLAAAMGEGKFSTLDPKERASLLKTCLEYGVGRPRPQDPMSPDEDEDEPKTGIRFGVAEGTEGGEDPALHEVLPEEGVGKEP
jgi:hypothetical protein